MRGALLGGLLLLAACGEKPAEAPKETAPAVPAAPSAAKALRSAAYVCEKDMPITAIYGTDAEGREDVALIVQGLDIRLRQTESASGARYVSEQGLEAGNGLVWWTKGEEALLQRVPLAKLNDPAAATTIRVCELKTETDAPAKAG